MPREPRLLLSQSYYHVMARGNNRMTLFHDAADYQRYLDLIGRFKAEHPFALFHYCLMPNHVHLLVRTKSAEHFATFMKQLNLAYVHYYKRKYGWSGHLWQGRYKSQPVGKDSYFLQCGKYIEANPKRAGLVKTPGAWRYSSYRYYATGRSDTLITPDPFFDGLGTSALERRGCYRELVVAERVAETYKRPVWGSHRQRYQERQKVRRRLKV